MDTERHFTDGGARLGSLRWRFYECEAQRKDTELAGGA